MDVLQLLVALVVVAGVLFFVVRFYLNNPDRGTAMRAAAGKLGLRYRPSGDLRLRDRLPLLSIFGPHFDGEFHSVLEGTWKGAEIVVFDYRLEKRSPGGGPEHDDDDLDDYDRRDGIALGDLLDESGPSSYTTVVVLRLPDSIRNGRHVFGPWTIEFIGEWGAAFTRTGSAFAGTTHLENRAPWVDPEDLPAYVEEAVALIHAPDGSNLLARN